MRFILDLKKRKRTLRSPEHYFVYFNTPLTSPHVADETGNKHLPQAEPR